MRLKILFIAALAGILALSAAPTFAAEDYSAYIKVVYDSDDATDNIRRAIIQAKANPGKEKIILSNQGEGTTTWVSGPIYMGNDMELHLEAGVTLQAKSGAFENLRQPFINIDSKSNVTISGANNTTSVITMLQEEYTSGEHRHCISVSGSTNVTITGLTAEESGGDGICISDMNLSDGVVTGQNENVLVENVICDGNARNGISIISGNNVTVNNCKLLNTGKDITPGLITSPHAGIDIEPEERVGGVNNLSITNCVFDSNRVRGLLLTLKKQWPNQNLIINVSDCVFRNSSHGITVQYKKASVWDKTTFKNCLVENTVNYPVYVKNWAHDKYPIEFENFAVISPSSQNEDVLGVFTINTIDDAANGDMDIASSGNVVFDNVYVFGNELPSAVYINGMSEDAKIKAVSGTIYSDKSGDTINKANNNYEDVTLSIENTTKTKEAFLSEIGFSGYSE